MSIPSVTVVIPTYQCDRYIGQAIQSVFDQTQCSYEIVIIDDGSADQTHDIVTDYAQKASRATPPISLHYYKQDNQGVCAARNRGLELARGEFVVFLDADDYFLPNKLTDQVAVFEAYPQIGLVQTGWQRVDINGDLLKEIRPWESTATLDLEAWLRFKPVLPSAMMFRRHWLEKIGGFDPSYQVAEDVDLVFRLSLAGCASEWLKQVTVAYRQHPGNTMNDGLAQARDVQRVITHFFEQPNLPESIKLIENDIRYNTLVWIACYLYRTGHQNKAIEFLRRSRNVSPYLPTETVVNWVESLANFFETFDQQLDINHLTSSSSWQDLVQWTLSL